LRVFGKNDILDSQALARFGAERHAHLPIFVPATQEMQELQTLRMRRNDLIAMRVSEKQRLKHPNYNSLKDSLDKVCDILTQEIMIIDKKIAELIDNNDVLRSKKEILTAFKGVGEQTGNLLLTMCPELGTLTRRQIASLAGVAPHPQESGKYQGYRSTKGGRSEVKKALFMSTLSAKSYNPVLKEFYDRLVTRGKKKMVALTATMRKMIVILNAKVRDFLQDQANVTQNPSC
jgi:transposase